MFADVIANDDLSLIFVLLGIALILIGAYLAYTRAIVPAIVIAVFGLILIIVGA